MQKLKGTTWIQCFHFTNDYAHIIPSNSININWATLQTMTDADVIAKLNSLPPPATGAAWV